MNPERDLYKSTIVEANPLTPKFLRQQTLLPEAEWDQNFRQLVEEKIKQKQLEIFYRYKQQLGLDDSKLKGKKFLDLGCGGGEFVQGCIERGVTNEAYGIDVRFDVESSLIQDQFQKHIFSGSFEEDFPVTGLDYVLSIAAVPLEEWDEEKERNFIRILEKALSSIKKDGEIRMAQIFTPAKSTPVPYLEESFEKLTESLARISKIHNIEYKIEPTGFHISGHMNDIILESVLVIRRLPE